MVLSPCRSINGATQIPWTSKAVMQVARYAATAAMTKINETGICASVLSGEPSMMAALDRDGIGAPTVAAYFDTRKAHRDYLLEGGICGGAEPDENPCFRLFARTTRRMAIAVATTGTARTSRRIRIRIISPPPIFKSPNVGCGMVFLAGAVSSNVPDQRSGGTGLRL